MNSFLNTLGGLQQSRQNQMAIDNQVAQQKAAQQQAEQQVMAINTAQELMQNGTPDQIAQFGIANPEIMERIVSAVNWKDEKQKQGRLNYAKQVASGAVDPVMAIQQRIAEVEAMGGDASQLKQTAQLPPDQIIEQAKKDISVMDPKGYIDFLTVQGGGITPQQQQQNRFRQQELGLQREKFNFDKQMKRLDFELKKAERQAKQAQGTAKEQEAKLKLDQAKAKADEAKIQDEQSLNTKVFTTKNNLQTVKDLLSNDNFIDDLTGKSGVVQSFGIRPTQDARDAQILFNNIVSSETLNNLGVMSGPLTDKDIEVIRSASTKLKEGMSKGAMKAELTKMVNAYNRVLNNYEKEANRKGYNVDSSVSDSVVFTSDKYGDVTEADIQETMSKNGLSRAQVLERL